MALDISAAQARNNMAAVREQWVAAHLGQISASISTASEGGEMAASYELQVGESEEAGLEQVMDALTGQGFSVVRRRKHAAVKATVSLSVTGFTAGSRAREEASDCKEEVVLEISWAEEAEESEEPAGFTLPRTPAPLI